MLTTDDVGFALRLVVSASNGAGTVSHASAQSGVVGTNPPVLVIAPTVSGTARDGAVLTAVDGTWAGPVVAVTTYEWWRCDAAGSNCSIAAGATGQSLVLGGADIGLTLRARVVRTSAGGTTAAFSQPTAPVRRRAAGEPRRAADRRRRRRRQAAERRARHLDRHAADRASATAGGAATRTARPARTSTGRPTRPTGAMPEDEGARLRVVVTAGNAVGSAVATSAADRGGADRPAADARRHRRSTSLPVRSPSARCSARSPARGAERSRSRSRTPGRAATPRSWPAPRSRAPPRAPTASRPPTSAGGSSCA